MLYSLNEHQVKLLGKEHFIASNASVMGNVELHDCSSVWFSAVIRGDNDLISIGEGSNIQDGAVLHTDPGIPLTIGKFVTIGHLAMLHGCEIGEGSLIGIGAVVLNGARIGKGCLIGAKALITEGMEIPDYSMVLGAPAKIKRTLDQEQVKVLRQNALHYVDRMRIFCNGLKIQT